MIPLSVKNLWEERYGIAGKTLDVRMIRKVIQLPEDARTKGPEEVQRIFAAESAKLIAELADVRERAEEGEDFASLVERGAVRKGHPVKVLGQGDLGVKVSVTADAFSASAKDKIEAAGGSVTVS